MVGILFRFLLGRLGLFSGAMLVSGRVIVFCCFAILVFFLLVVGCWFFFLSSTPPRNANSKTSPVLESLGFDSHQELPMHPEHRGSFFFSVGKLGELLQISQTQWVI